MSTLKDLMPGLVILSVSFALSTGLAGCFDGKTEVRAVPPIPALPTTRSITAEGMNVYTFEHKGHLFIAAYGVGILHHPACPCFDPRNSQRYP